MARNVYFDPFGMYTAGQELGAARETNLQDATRKARNDDFNFNYLKPLELKSAVRDDAFGEYAVPYRQDMLRSSARTANAGAFNADVGIAKDYAAWSGVSDPAMNAYHNRFGVTPKVDQFTSAPDPRVTKIAQAQIAYDKLLSQVPDLDDKATLEQIRAQDAYMQSAQQQIAQQFGLSPQDITNPLPPNPVANNPVPDISYVDAQGNVVGRQIDPRTRFNEWNLRPQTLQDEALRYKYQTDNWDMRKELSDAERAQQYLELQQGYQQNRPGANPTGSVLPGVF